MMVICIIGILAAIAIPNFMNYQAQSRQAEAKAELGGIMTSELAYYSDLSVYAQDFTQIGFQIVGVSQYYDFTVTAPVSGGSGSYSWPSGAWIGLHGTPGDGPYGSGDGNIGLNALPGATSTAFTAIAVGNIDNDPTLDVWSINQVGDLENPVNDVYQ